MSTEFYWVAVVLTTVLSVARLSRLLVIDKFPPVKHFRDKYENRTDGSDWQWLAMCAFCMAPWVTLVIGGWGLLADVYGSGDTIVGNDAPWFMLWWAFNGWLAISYLAGSYVARDGSGADGV